MLLRPPRPPCCCLPPRRPCSHHRRPSQLVSSLKGLSLLSPSWFPLLLRSAVHRVRFDLRASPSSSARVGGLFYSGSSLQSSGSSRGACRRQAVSYCSSPPRSAPNSSQDLSSPTAEDSMQGWQLVRAPFWWRKSTSPRWPPHSLLHRPAPRSPPHSRQSPRSPAHFGLNPFNKKPGQLKKHQIRCHHCLSLGHIAKNCRDPWRCAVCLRWGHRARDCKKRCSPPLPQARRAPSSAPAPTMPRLGDACTRPAELFSVVQCTPDMLVQRAHLEGHGVIARTLLLLQLAVVGWHSCSYFVSDQLPKLFFMRCTHAS